MFVLGMYFQGVGLLLHKKAIDAGFTYNLMGFNSIKTCWEKSKPVVVKLREQLNDPGLFWGVEYLYSEMKKRQQLASKTA